MVRTGDARNWKWDAAADAADFLLLVLPQQQPPLLHQQSAMIITKLKLITWRGRWQWLCWCRRSALMTTTTMRVTRRWHCTCAAESDLLCCCCIYYVIVGNSKRSRDGHLRDARRCYTESGSGQMVPWVHRSESGSGKMVPWVHRSASSSSVYTWLSISPDASVCPSVYENI